MIYLQVVIEFESGKQINTVHGEVFIDRVKFSR